MIDNSNYTESYKQLLRELLTRGVEQLNGRTGARVKAVAGAWVIQVAPGRSNDLLPLPAVRLLRPRTAAAEVAWFLSGSMNGLDLEALGTKIWSKFMGSTGTIPTAYGYRWRAAFNCDQIALALRALRADPTDRQVVVTAWDPRVDGLGRADPSVKNVPCPTQFTLSTVGGLLHSSLLIRSSDVFVGLPYDVAGHALLTQAIANSLKLKIGVLTFTLAHAHLYQCHWDMAREACRVRAKFPRVPMPDCTVEDIEQDPHDYVRTLELRQRGTEWPEYDPKPELVL